MKKKRCTRCAKQRTLNRFNKDKTTKDGHAFECKLCASNRVKRWLRKGTAQEREKKKLNRQISHKKMRERNRQFILEFLKKHPCVDCGEPDPIVLDFDHVRGNKILNISYMMNNSYSIEKLSLEVTKCEVRCANCHRRVTCKQQGWYKG